MAYPHGDIAANIAAFCDRLRRDHGFLIGVGDVHDAVLSVETVGVADRVDVRTALGLVLSACRDDQDRFDRLFDEFFAPGPGGVAQHQMPGLEEDVAPIRDEGDPDRLDGERGGDDADDDSGEDGVAGDAATPDDVIEDAPSEVAGGLRRARYSSTVLEAGGALLPETGMAAMLVAATALVNRLEHGRTRRYRPQQRGPRFDARRTMRSSLATGGELIRPRYLGHPPNHPRFVVVIDGSRSMSSFAPTTLQFALALAQRTRRVEAFTFSTALRCVTSELRQAAARGDASIEGLDEAWGGGTRIGDCLATLVREHGDRVLGPQCLVVIASDGLDVGDVRPLRDAMRTLRRRSCGVVWLNPLLASPGYEPTARGMQSALPYVTTFACARTPTEFLALATSVRVAR